MRTNRLVAVLVSFLLVLLGLGGSPASAAPADDPVAHAGSVTGVVATQGGDPVAGVDVLLLADPAVAAIARVTSDSSGEYTLADVPDGTYRVQFLPGDGASVSDLAPQYFDAVATWDEAQDVVVAGGPVEAVDARLTPVAADGAEGAALTDAASGSTAPEPSATGPAEPTQPVEPPSPDPSDSSQPTEPATQTVSKPGTPDVADPTATAPSASEPAAVEPTEPTAPESTTPEPTAPEPTAPTWTEPSDDPTSESLPADPTGPGVPAGAAAALMTEAEPLVLLADAAAGTISGTVTEKGSGAAVPTVSVVLNRGIQYSSGVPMTYSYYQQVSTTSTGTYAFTGIPDGSYKIKVTPSYGSTLAPYWVGGPTEAEATELVMTGGIGLAGQDVALPLGARLSGTVRGGSTLTAIPNASIEVRRAWGSSWQTVATVYANTSGAFSVPGLPAGEYRVWVSAPYGTSWMSSWVGGATFDSATRYPVELGDAPPAIDVVLFAGATITGTVTAGADPLPMATVAAVRLDGTTPVDVVSRSTSTDGTYSLGGLPAGTYRIRVNAPYQSQWVTTWLGGTLTVDGAAEVVVAAGSTVGGKHIEMILGASISGTVTSASGAVSGATIYAYVPTQWGGYTAVGSSVTSNASGAFAVRGLPAGTYRLMITPPSGSELLSTWIGGADFATATQYTVALGGSATAGTTVLQLGSLLSGSVLGDGVGIANAGVTAYRVGSAGSQEWLDSTSTNFDGEFTFTKRMPAGSIRLYASLNTYTYGPSPYLTTWFDGKQSFADATPIEIVAGEPTSVSLALIKGASVSGQVLAGAPAIPVEDATVEVCRDSFWNCKSLTTGADGTYSAIGLEAGKYLVRALPPAGSNLLPAYFGGTDQNSATAITLVLGQTAAGTTMTLPLGAEIGGRALDPEGAAVAGASVTAYRTAAAGTSWDASVQATTLADGSYVLHGLVPGEYRIRVVPASSSPLASGWFGAGTSWASATEITASAGDELSGKDVTLTLGATLSGRVLGGPDLGVEDATVAVYVATQNGYEQVKTTTSDTDGSYSIRGLGAGTYRIQVTTDSSSLWMSTWLGGDSYYSATPIAIDGADVVANITVPRGGIISGTITQAASGAAVANVAVQVCRMDYDYDSENYCGSATSVNTDANGDYRFTRLAPGTYKVAVGANGWSSGAWIETWYGGEDVVTATRMGITYGSELSDVDLALVAGGSISGTVKAGAPATAVSYAYVSAYRVSGAGYVYAKQAYASNGIFSITGLIPVSTSSRRRPARPGSPPGTAARPRRRPRA